MNDFDQDQARTVAERFDKLEARISKLESITLQTAEKRTLVLSKSEKGLPRALSKLIQEGFLNTPKLRKEVQDEMKRQGYYYSTQAIQNTLARDFMKKKGILTRIGKRGKWRYVLKK